MKPRWALLLALGAVTAGGRASAEPAADAGAAAVSELHAIALAELSVGELGAQNGRSDEVRELGRKLVLDYEGMDQKIIALARAKRWTLSNQVEGDDLQHLLGARDRLAKAPPNDFDAHFLSEVEGVEGTATGLVARAIPTVKDADTERLFADALPVLANHESAAATVVSEAH